MGTSVQNGWTIGNIENVDTRLGPWDTTAEFLADIGVTQRYPGMTVIITGSGNVQEYWFPGEDVEDGDLVLKGGNSFPYYGDAVITGSLLVSGGSAEGAITASTLHLPDLPTGEDNTVLIKKANGNIVTDEIDPRVWSGDFVGGEGSGSRVPFYQDTADLNSTSNFTYILEPSLLTVKGKVGFGTCSIAGKDGNISASNNIRAGNNILSSNFLVKDTGNQGTRFAAKSDGEIKLGDTNTVTNYIAIANHFNREITASLISASEGFTGSLFGSASFSTSASYAISSSQSITSSFATSASYALSSSFATSASHANRSNEAKKIDINATSAGTDFPLALLELAPNPAKVYRESVQKVTYNPDTETFTSFKISASKELFASTSNANGANYNTLMVNTTTGEFFHTGSYGGGGSGTPGGSNTEVQFNSNGGFGGDSKFTFDPTSFADLRLDAGGNTSQFIMSGSTGANLILKSTSATPNQVWFQKADASTIRVIGQEGTTNNLYISDNIAGNNKTILFDGANGEITASLISASVGFTGSLFGTASFATSASQAISSSFAITASYALSASNALDAVSSSYALSASYALSSSHAEFANAASSSDDFKTTGVKIGVGASDPKIGVWSGTDTLRAYPYFTFDGSHFIVASTGGTQNAFVVTGSNGNVSCGQIRALGANFSSDSVQAGKAGIKVGTTNAMPQIPGNLQVMWEGLGQGKSGQIGYRVGTSRRETKYDIKPLTSEVIDGLNQLQPVTYIYKADKEKQTVGGFIAEEVAEINPLFAKWGPNYKVNNSGSLEINNILDDTLIPSDIDDRTILAAAVAKIQQLEKEIQQLKAKIT